MYDITTYLYFVLWNNHCNSTPRRSHAYISKYEKDMCNPLTLVNRNQYRIQENEFLYNLYKWWKEDYHVNYSFQANDITTLLA